MKGRIASTLGLWGGLFLGLYLVGPAFAVWLLAATAVAAQWELYGMLTKVGFKPYRRVGCALGGLTVLGAYHLPQAHDTLIVLAVVVPTLTLLVHKPEGSRIHGLVPTLFGVLFIPYMLSFLARCIILYPDLEKQGLALAVLILAMAKFTDVGGLVVGSRIGKTKLAPSISPAKTWEGVAGGLGLSAAVSGLAVLLLPLLLPGMVQFPSFLTPMLAALIAIPVGAMAVASDLVESVFKREADVKDSGKLLPGIGGAFDLVDSLVLSAPFGYLLCRLLGY